MTLLLYEAMHLEHLYNDLRCSEYVSDSSLLTHKSFKLSVYSYIRE
jgi:hypothetical protein